MSDKFAFTTSTNLTIPLDICNIIAEYEAPLKLLDWINPDKINWHNLSLNSTAIWLLEKNPEKIDWKYLSANPAAIPLLEKNSDKIYWVWLSSNTAAIELIKTHSVELDWEYVCLTPTVKSMRLLKKNPDKINWNYLSLNPAIFEKDLSRIKQMGAYIAKQNKI